MPAKKPTGQRRKMGRPSTPRNLRRRNRVVTLVTDGELKSLEDLAVDWQLTLSATVHEILLKGICSYRADEKRKAAKQVLPPIEK